MPYREGPHPDLEFNPDIHEEVKPHPKSKGDKTWVRKTAVETEKQAEEKTQLRNLVKRPNWFTRLFKIGEGRKDTAVDILTEEGLEKELESFDHDVQFKDGSDYAFVRGIINGHNIEFSRPHSVWSDSIKNWFGATLDCYIDGQKVDGYDTKKIIKKILPLLLQREKNEIRNKEFEQRLKTKSNILEVLGKKQNKNLLSGPEPKQLPPHEKD